jgi:1,4-dihydroxy-2-naphthoate octaprenyltransferase
MISRSSLEHIRIPFSFFLMPVFFLALICTGPLDAEKAWIVFFVLHLLLYPASNGFNSYYDRDIGSIGLLRHPPTVTKDLLWFSLVLDVTAVAAALLVSPIFALGCFLYGCASKAYSWDRIRIKKYPVTGWLCTGICQGLFTFLLVAGNVGVNAVDVLSFRVLFPSLASTLFLLGFYPLTQIYQHEEDAKRNDCTISMKLGIRGTFYFCAPFLLVSTAGFFYYFYLLFGFGRALFFLFMLVPAAAYFVSWLINVTKDSGKADFDHAMRMNTIASSGLNAFSLASIFLLKII